MTHTPLDDGSSLTSRYSHRRYALSLSENESQALNDILHDINEYVTDEMFSSPRGLASFRRLLEKSDVMQGEIITSKKYSYTETKE